MNEDRRRKKRLERERRKKDSTRKSSSGAGVRMVPSSEMESEKYRLVYRCKDDAERQRRVERMKQNLGKPFIRMPGNPDPKSVAFISIDGKKITVEAVEMVYNDAALMDAVSNYGEDGPLYEATCEGLQLEVYKFAVVAYGKRGVQ